MAIDNSVQPTSSFLTKEIETRIFQLVRSWEDTLKSLNESKTFYAVAEHVVENLSPFSPAIKLSVEHRYVNQFTDLHIAKMKDSSLDVGDILKYVPVTKSTLDITIIGLSCGLITARYLIDFKSGKIIVTNAGNRVTCNGAIGSLHLKDVIDFTNGLVGVDPLATPYYSLTEPE